MASISLEWEFHCQGHYDDLFAELAQHMDTHTDMAPMAIHCFPDTDCCVGDAVNSGFEETLPEYHSHVEDSVMFVPMFCMWCIHDDWLSMAERMVQCVVCAAEYGVRGPLFFFLFPPGTTMSPCSAGTSRCTRHGQTRQCCAQP